MWAGVGLQRKGVDGLGLGIAHVSNSTAAPGTVEALCGSSWSGVRTECCIEAGVVTAGLEKMVRHHEDMSCVMSWDGLS